MRKFFTYKSIIILIVLFLILFLSIELPGLLKAGSMLASGKSDTVISESKDSSGSMDNKSISSGTSLSSSSGSAFDVSSAADAPEDTSMNSSNDKSLSASGGPDVSGSSSDTRNPGQVSHKYTDAINVRNTRISIGENKDNIIRKLGNPNRIVQTEYDFEYYVYNNDYRRLLFVAVKDGKVTGYYTDSVDFNYKGISSGSGVDDVNHALGETFALNKVLTYHKNNTTIKILMDKLGTGKVIGIYVLSDKVKLIGFTKQVMSNIELLIFDLTNSIRVRNKEAILSWSSSAAISARKHSTDMAVNNYFSHIDPFGSYPSSRLLNEGINYSTCGENIIAGYGTAILSSHGWFNSPDHRKIILNKNFKSLGTGFYYKHKSIYKTYITADFYG